MPNKTREKLIDVARRLFARKGIENTTMAEIASASDKGRRTIYTYFRSKTEIYDAVLESESEKIIERLREAYALDIPPLKKLHRFIVLRCEILRMESESVFSPSEMQRSLLNRDNKRYERITQLALEKERAMWNGIMLQCLDLPEVDRRQLARLKVVMPLLQQGIDISFIHNNYSAIGIDKASYPNMVADFLINAILKK